VCLTLYVVFTKIQKKLPIFSRTLAVAKQKPYQYVTAKVNIYILINKLFADFLVYFNLI